MDKFIGHILLVNFIEYKKNYYKVLRKLRDRYQHLWLIIRFFKK